MKESRKRIHRRGARKPNPIRLSALGEPRDVPLLLGIPLVPGGDRPLGRGEVGSTQPAWLSQGPLVAEPNPGCHQLVYPPAHGRCSGAGVESRATPHEGGARISGWPGGQSEAPNTAIGIGRRQQVGQSYLLRHRGTDRGVAQAVRVPNRALECNQVWKSIAFPGSRLRFSVGPMQTLAKNIPLIFAAGPVLFFALPLTGISEDPAEHFDLWTLLVLK
jgi:hypothetical protein